VRSGASNKSEITSPAPDIARLLDALRNAPFYAGQLVEVGIAEPRQPRFFDNERPMLQPLRDRLRKTGIERLYEHQAAAFDLAEAGRDLIVTSGTSSGKTLCYNLPVINRLMQEPAARALYIFPTKALAQDQLSKLGALLPGGLKAAAYDGDTPKSKRAAIRAGTHIILTNPDMLHVGILPNNPGWAAFLRSLRFVVIDEVHSYSGVFGSNVALILRRLSRLCEWQGSKPQFIGCSATIANGKELFQELTGRDAELVETDGSASGRRYLAMWNPPEVDEGVRRSSNSEASQLLGSLAARGARTLAFAKSRVAAELVLRYTREALGVGEPELARRIESYRAGYTPEERRAIERRLFDGDLVGLSSTDAMELGVDVGTLDAVIMNGYPGSISSLRQQAGRAGRGTRDSLGILVAKNDPLDQYYMRHPEQLLGGKAESVRIHASNPFILAQQLRCAAHERPLAPTELHYFPDSALEVLEALEESGLIVRRSGLWFHPSQTSPAPEVDIRGSGGPTFTLESPAGVLATMEQWRAYAHAHPGAVYLHRGFQYIVRTMDVPAKRIEVEPTLLEYYTQSVSETAVASTADLGTRPLGTAELRLQGLVVTTAVTAYKKKSLADDSVLGIEDLDLPETTIDTIGVRLDLPVGPGGPLREEGGVHALEHLLVALAPTIAQCEPRDLGSAFYAIWPETGCPAIFVFDAVPGGIGLSQALFENAGEWLRRVAEQLFACGCKTGCPACVLSPRCPYSNDGVDKDAAKDVLLSLNLS
jgi:DEAD/DEAH box helicase domain-containing protein